jgi:FMN-dependent NADH-azoreductase
VNSSPRGPASYSSRIARLLAERLAGDIPHAIKVRDLPRKPLPHISEEFVGGIYTASDHRSEPQKAAVARSDEIIEEVLAADVIVIASAMINFGISSTLKSWIDHLVRSGATFRITDKGAEGLVKGKKVYIVRASGGVYSQGPMASFNFQDTYLKLILGFIGITDIEVIAIEGINLGPEAAEKAVTAAEKRVSAVPPLQDVVASAA